MRVLGFSGLSRARSFKGERLPGLAEHEYDIVQGADAAAALSVDGAVVAASAEERFDRIKHSGAFPCQAARYCLDFAQLDARDLDCVAHGFSYGGEQQAYAELPPFYRDLYSEVLAPDVNRAVAEDALGVDLSERFLAVPHHEAHAMSAYVPSGFEDALVLVTDGLGERYSASVMHVSPERIETLLEVPAHDSLGLLYGIVTLYLGFAFADGEYKVMGLAPYGDPARFADAFMGRWVQLQADGGYRVPLLLENVSDLDKQTFRGALAAIERVCGPRRAPDAPIEQRHMDVAAALQAALQAAQLHLLRHWRAATGLRHLCIAGGVGLNCVVNGAVLRSGIFDDVYVPPAAGDDGTAIGAALVACRALGGAPRPSATPLLGPSYEAPACRRAVAQHASLEAESFVDDEALAAHVAELLDEGQIVAWFQGRMEFGPRALGNRSILADPRRAEMRDRINALVKQRESFRPFAPAVVEEAAHEVFEIAAEEAHRFADMLFVAYVRDEYVASLGATTHVDGSARVQTVSRARNPRFWQLIRGFEARTGLPVVLNTSFNVAGQPIVRSPEEAVATFLATDLDALVLQDTVIRRSATAAATR